MGTRLCVLAAVAAVGATVVGCGGTEPIQQPFASISTTTTRIASADIVGLNREPSEVCAPPTPANIAPASIVVADPDLLDGVCALGLQNRVRALIGPVPDYLAGVMGKVPQLADGVRADISLGTDRSVAANNRVGRTVVIPAPEADWRASFLALADAVRMPAQARAVLDRYQKSADDAAAQINANQYVVSLVRFTDDKKALAEGTAPLAAQVLADLKAARPEPQRKYEAVHMLDGDFSAAEGDVIYIGYQGDTGRDFGSQAMTSDAWKELRAVTAKRQLLVQDSAWFAAGGPVAAGIVLTDVATSIKSSS